MLELSRHCMRIFARLPGNNAVLLGMAYAEYAYQDERREIRESITLAWQPALHASHVLEEHCLQEG